MTNLVLTFNAKATEAMGANTRLRVKSMKRGGVEYVALRPSYRVSGKNAMIRVNKGDDGNLTAELPEDLITELTLPALKSNHTAYKFDDVGYGWFLLKGDQELNERKDPIVTISKARKTKARGAAAEGAEDNTATEDTNGEDQGEQTAVEPEAPAPVAEETKPAPAKKTTAKKASAKKAEKKAPWDKEPAAETKSAGEPQEQPQATPEGEQTGTSEGEAVPE